MKKIELIKKFSEEDARIYELLEQVVICLESHFDKKNGYEKTKEALNTLEVAIQSVIQNGYDSIMMQKGLKLIKTALERLESGDFGRVKVENYEIPDDNFLKSFIENCIKAA